MRRRRRSALVIAVVVAATSLAACELPLEEGSGGLSWLALGDSFSSGEGLIDAFDQPSTHNCQRSPRAYPMLAAAGVRASQSFGAVTSLACTGATAMRDHNDPQSDHNDATRQLDMLPADARFDVITMTFGGNDLAFEGVLKSCLLNLAGEYYDAYRRGLLYLLLVTLRDGFCSINRDGISTAVAGLETYFTNELFARAAARLKRGGRLYVLGYPHLFAPSGSWSSLARFLPTRCYGIASDDADSMGWAVDQLNGAMKRAAGQVKAAAAVADRTVEYIAVDGEFSGHELCASRDAWINGFPVVDLEDRGSLEARLKPSFHPNAGGHQAMARLLIRQVDAQLGSET